MVWSPRFTAADAGPNFQQAAVDEEPMMRHADVGDLLTRGWEVRVAAVQRVWDALGMDVEDRLARHLASWLGVWPPPRPGLTVVGSPRRMTPGWDGTIRMVAGVSTPEATVISVPPAAAETVRALGDDLDSISAGLGEALGRPGGRLFSGAFRWSTRPAEDLGRGVWLPVGDPRVLPWLVPFGGEVLVGFAGRDVAAGVGRKIHDAWGHELAVVTEPSHRGEGWATDLVAQAAHRVLADGAVPTYLHALDNDASAGTADAAGFPDRGWRIHGLSTPPEPRDR